MRGGDVLWKGGKEVRVGEGRRESYEKRERERMRVEDGRRERERERMSRGGRRIVMKEWEGEERGLQILPVANSTILNSFQEITLPSPPPLLLLLLVSSPLPVLYLPSLLFHSNFSLLYLLISTSSIVLLSFIFSASVFYVYIVIFYPPFSPFFTACFPLPCLSLGLS